MLPARPNRLISTFSNYGAAMRLDEYLVSEGLAASRSRAKRLIGRGLVEVDGAVASKPAQKVDYRQRVVVRGEDMPEGYLKLRGIQEATGILRAGDAVLDVGSSAGGFLRFAAGIASRVVGIEFSGEFRGPLEDVERSLPNVRVVFGNAFSIGLPSLDGPYDVILNDLTVEPFTSVEVLERFLPLLKEHGRVLQVVKLGPRGTPWPLAEKLESMGLTVKSVIEPEKMEAYIIAEK